MGILLKLAFLFFIGSVSGWVLELFFRRFACKENTEHKWINPGFCTGPYLPLYGVGLCILYLIASSEQFIKSGNSAVHKILLFILMAALMTLLEYIAGLISLKVSSVRLWDYSNEKWNIKGIICPKFSLCWALLGGFYYFALHPGINLCVHWLSQNLAFSFFIGLFFGFFIIDLCKSFSLVAKLKKYADENNLIIRYEQIKLQIRKSSEKSFEKYRFFRPFSSTKPIFEHIKDISETLEKKYRKK